MIRNEPRWKTLCMYVSTLSTVDPPLESSLTDTTRGSPRLRFIWNSSRATLPSGKPRAGIPKRGLYLQSRPPWFQLSAIPSRPRTRPVVCVNWLWQWLDSSFAVTVRAPYEDCYSKAPYEGCNSKVPSNKVWPQQILSLVIGWVDPYILISLSAALGL